MADLLLQGRSMAERPGPTPKPKTDVVARRMGDTAVLVDLGTNQIFELNATGYRIWELLGAGLDRDAIAGRLEQEFAGERAQLERDVDELVLTLQAEGLLRQE